MPQMDWLRSIIYGFVTGAAEFLPISSVAHGEIVLKILGAESNQTLLSLMTRIGMLAAVFCACSAQFRTIRHDCRISSGRRRSAAAEGVFTMRLFRTALVPLIICYLFSRKAASFDGKFQYLAVFLVINGLLIFFPEYLPSANKDSRSVAGYHGILLGLGAGMSVLPGISAVAAATSLGSALGMKRQFALDFAFLLTVPVLVIGILLNAAVLAVGGIGTISVLILIRYILAALMAFAGSWCAILLMRFLSVNIGYSWFAYYSWGAALFSFILFMTI